MVTIEPEAIPSLDPSLITVVDVGPRTCVQLAMAAFMDIVSSEVPSIQDDELGAQVKSERDDFYREVAKIHQPGTRPPWLDDPEVDFEPDVEREEMKEILRYKRDGDHIFSPYRWIIGW